MLTHRPRPESRCSSRLAAGRWIALPMMYIFLAATVIMLVNMLIAIMAKSFDDIYESQQVRAATRDTAFIARERSSSHLRPTLRRVFARA